MYSGSTLTKYSGRVIGAHQKFDRVARKQLGRLLKKQTDFPPAKQILLFEGKNGPDAIKRKSPAQHEPWHYYSPFDEEDSQLIELIEDHYEQLVSQIKKGNQERIAFEAAWLAHALVDGLTPAHHYPYEEKLSEIRGEEKETRTTVREKIIPKGVTKRDTFKKSWKVYGPKGLMTTHGLFEMGIAAIIAPLGFGEAHPTRADIERMLEIGPTEWFKQSSREIAVLDMYEKYYDKGWTTRLANQVRHKLAPTIIKTVSLTWYSALHDAGIKVLDEPVKAKAKKRGRS
ncbi:MAG: hypothetical protein U5L95_03610 [Candidatus Saccharibacteria bacterium]|nr:hypothetical protein [Candidatus Saccharibacteria bacterium]